jgi:hypothetical protein
VGGGRADDRPGVMRVYGDTEVIRSRARAMRDQACEIRREADELLGRAEAAMWHGWAADAMRSHARDRVAALRRTALSHDDAAAALERHAAEVDRLKALIAALEQRFHRLVSGAKDRLAEVAHQPLDGLRRLLPDPVDELLVRFSAPAAGHKEWLSVDLPGLRR